MNNCKHDRLQHTTFEAASGGPHPYRFHVLRCRDCEQPVAVFPLEKSGSLLEIVTRGFSDIIRAIQGLEEAFTRK